MTEPLTIVFMPESAYGPTNNCIGIGKVLEQRGHRVVFAAEASWKGRLEPLGFEEDLVDLAPPAEPATRTPASSGPTSSPRPRPSSASRRSSSSTPFIRPVWEPDRRGEVLRATAPGDPRPSPARRDRRGQRERLPGAAHRTARRGCAS